MKLQAMSTSPLYTRTRYFCRKNKTFNKDNTWNSNKPQLHTYHSQWSDVFFKVNIKYKLIFQRLCDLWLLTKDIKKENRFFHQPEKLAASGTVFWRPGRDDRSSDSPQRCNTKHTSQVSIDVLPAYDPVQGPGWPLCTWVQVHYLQMTQSRAFGLMCKAARTYGLFR